MSSKIIAAFLLVAFVALASASSYCGTTDAEIRANLALKWVAAFKSINSTLYIYGPQPVPQYPPDVIAGNIAYDPSLVKLDRIFVGDQYYNVPTFALFGNITVLYGIPGQPQGVTSYTGNMDIVPDILANGLPSCETGLVYHHIQLSNINNSAYAPGATAIRRFTFHDTERGIDDILQLSVAGVAELFWRRGYPFPVNSLAPPAQSCKASVTLVKSGDVYNGNQQAYRFLVTNTGTKTIATLSANVNFGSSTVSQQFNYNPSTGALTGFYQLAPGAQWNQQAGFVATGSSTPFVVSSSATCSA